MFPLVPSEHNGGMDRPLARWQETVWWKIFGTAVLILFALIAIWSLAMPLLSGPDEPTHVVKAAAVARGQFTGECRDNSADHAGVCAKSSPFTEVTVPAFYSLLRNGGNIPGTLIPHHGVECYARRILIPASCVIYASTTTYQNLVRSAWIYDGRYPPMYYLVAGLPTLVGEGRWVLYLMRFFVVLVEALLLASAVFAVIRLTRDRLHLVAMAIAATPMVLYLGGVINASGIEITAALAFWVLGSLTVTVAHPPRWLLIDATIAALVFVSSRSLSLLWIALAITAIAALSTRDQLVALIHRRGAQVAGVLFGVVSALDLVWIIYEHATAVDVASANAQALIPRPGTPEFTILRTSFHHSIYYLPGMIGVFGSFDTYAPRLTFVIWYLLGGALLLLSVCSVSWRRSLVLLGCAIGIVALPVLISSSQARHLGYVWSGRDTLPFAVGLPILCATALRGSRRERLVQGVVPAVVVLTSIGTFGAFYEALRRYSVGDQGPQLSFLWHPSWSPPLIGNLGVVAFLAAALLLASLLVIMATRVPRTVESGGADSSEESLATVEPYGGQSLGE